MPGRSPTTRGGAQKKATPQELDQRARQLVWTNEVIMMETELAETKAALADALAAKGKLLSVADGDKLQMQAKQHESMRTQAVEEARNALKKCSDMAEELATERARSLALHEELQRDRASAVKMRAALAPLMALVGEIFPELLPAVGIGGTPAISSPEVVGGAAAPVSAPAAASAPSQDPELIPTVEGQGDTTAEEQVLVA